MNIDYRTLKNKRQWKATTGLSEGQFLNLADHFAQSYYDIFGKTMAERQADSSTTSRFQTPADLLFFLLLSLKTGLGQDVLGFIHQIDGSTVSRNKQLGLRILQATLEKLNVLPRRQFEDIEDFENYFKEHQSLILDGEEQRVQRPSNQEIQKEFYSGKKNATRPKH